MGYRRHKYLVALDITSTDAGQTFTGLIRYQGEGSIDYRAANISGNFYQAHVHWGSQPTWHTEGIWVIGSRAQ